MVGEMTLFTCAKKEKKKKSVWWDYSKSQDKLNVNMTADQIFINTFLQFIFLQFLPQR